MYKPFSVSRQNVLCHVPTSNLSSAQSIRTAIEKYLQQATIKYQLYINSAATQPLVGYV